MFRPYVMANLTVGSLYLVFLLFLSTGLTVCYSFRLLYFAMCGDFNFFPSYSIVESNYNVWYDWVISYVYFWCLCSYLIDLSYSFYDLSTLLIEVFYCISVVYRWLSWL
jgi:hypothetical protein